MGNKHYVNGRYKEYKIRKELLKEGYDIAQRSAGSHSPIDIFAIHKERKEILLVQSKPDNFLKSSEKKILDEYDWLNGDFKVEFQVC
jgi:hypothetical protein